MANSIQPYKKPAPQRIAIIEPRLPEIGRLRLGDVKTGNKPGTPLNTFRVTSPDKRVVEAVAAAYGGKVTAWNQQWQATITARHVPVIIPPFANFSSCYELWLGGGCQRRCDGVNAHIVEQGPDGPYMIDRPCVCKPEKRDCKPTSRLNVMVRGVDTLGTFRLETHSVFAAIEFPGQVDLAAAAAEQGGLIPATLSIEDREMKKATEKFPRRFKVPVLRLNVSIEQLAGNSLPELPSAPPVAALPAPEPLPAPVQGQGPML